VGIGTTSPTQKLHVNGSLLVENSTGSALFFVNSSSGNVGIGTTSPTQKLTVAGNIGIQAGANAFIGTLDNFALSLRTNNADRVFITNTGNVGIGTTSPGSRLEVRGSTSDSSASALNITNSGGTSLLYVRNDGNVGIGTTTPAYKLDVVGAIRLQPSSAPTGANGVIYYDSSTNKFRCYQNGAWVDCIASGGLGGSGTTNYVAKFTDSTTLGNSQIFDNGTSVGIGTTTPTQKLHVNGSLLVENSTGSALFFVNSSSGNVGIGTTSPTQKLTVAGNIGIQAGANAFIGTLDNFALSLRTNNADRVFITNTGNVGIGTTSPGSRLEVRGSTSDSSASALNITNSGGTSLLYVRNDGNVGIGTTTPAYKLDVAGNIRAQTSLTAGINVETLSADKTLTPGTDKMYQYLSTGGANRIVYLATTTAKAGDKFIIKNNDSGSSNSYLKIQQGSTVLDYIYARSIREYIFDGTNWVSADVGTGISGSDSNVAIGYNATGYNSGAAVGYNAYGHNYGAAVGAYATGYNYGTAVGYSASGYNYSAAVGAYATGYNYGTAVGYNALGYSIGTAVGAVASGYNSGAAVGYNAYGHNYGAAVGAFASGYNYGTAVGYSASGYNYSAAVGYFATGYNYGTAVGAYAKGMRYGAALGYQAGYNIDTTADRYNVLVGAYSGYRLTTGIGNIIIGYGAGYDSTYSPTTGSYNILIGYNAWTPATTTSNFLNIGGLIFGTNLSTTPNTISTGNVGIGTTTPTQKLHVNGSLLVENSTGSALFFVNSSSGNVGIGTTSPNQKLHVIGNINASGYVYGLTGLCIGSDCKTSWSQIGSISPWDNSTTQIFVRAGYPTYINASNTLFINGTSGNVGIGTTTPSEKLEVQGRILVASSSQFELQPSDLI
ncbi:MAG: hypothetical protein NDF58_08925, partial [archaeon YNP-LCB-024-027]|nr:hypothetical protein [Candidatus Culexarchaeum yellowstonense]